MHAGDIVRVLTKGEKEAEKKGKKSEALGRLCICKGATKAGVSRSGNTK
jgi:hypothetical protein